MGVGRERVGGGWGEGMEMVWRGHRDGVEKGGVMAAREGEEGEGVAPNSRFVLRRFSL